MQLDTSLDMAAQLLVRRLQMRAAAPPFSFAAEDIRDEDLIRLPTERLLAELEAVEQDLSPPATWRQAFELQSAELGSRAILVAAVEKYDLQADEWSTLLRAASCLRANLEDDQARTDLYLFVVAPAGTSTSEDWQRTARTLERSEHICRKYVWLPPDNPNDWESMADDLLNRTFLTSPVVAEAASRTTDLGPLDTILREYASEDKLTETALRAWTQILTRAVSPARVIAEELLAAVEGQSHEK